MEWMRPDTVVCRCEETSYDTLCRAWSQQAGSGARAVKLGTRAGLGPCQARMCGPTVAELAAHHGGEQSFVDNRPVAQHIRLGELASMEDEER